MSNITAHHPLTPSQGHALVASWKGSGLSQAAFCRTNSIETWRLAYWKKVLTRSSAVDAGFVELQAKKRQSGIAVQLRSGGVSIPIESGFDPVLLKAVVEALS